jgi:hypothetical protein
MPGWDDRGAAMDADCAAPTARAHDALFVSQCSLSGLQAKLPLLWPTPPETPPSPKHAYRSHYVYRGWADLLVPATWDTLSDFDLCLRLIDFSGLRPVLAQRLGWTSARGWMPFDPLSLFLLQAWQITSCCSRTQALSNLRDPRYADYATRFGFAPGVCPSEGGLRYFLTSLGAHAETSGHTVSVPLDDKRTVAVAVQDLNDLIAQSVTMIHDAGLLSPEAWTTALVCPDGMIHDAACRMRCAFVQDSCYQPVNAQTHTRPCPAKQADPPRRGCACDTAACAEICHHGTPRDPAARMVVYSGSNQRPDNPNQPATPTPDQPKQGKLRYGYRSLPLELADPIRRCSFVLLDHVCSAPEREENPAAALLRQVSTAYPTLHLDTTAGDAGLGYAAYLRTAYDLGVKRVVDLRAQKSDHDKEGWASRGYDDKGRPICPFGYAFTANGYDADRKRHKWVCAQACLKKATPRATLANVSYPPPECPYQRVDHPLGKIIDVAQCFADGSIRLVRDLPVDSPAWKRAYHRARNASESRHSTLERWDLKRLSVYGEPRSKAMIFQADVWLNLTTMARLVREATVAARSP